MISNYSTNPRNNRPVLGILGGMGPLASAEFLKTIYKFNIGESEQESPVCILYSDPTFPDRSQAIINGLEEKLVNILIETLEGIFEFGVSKVVISCITIHYFLPQLPGEIRKKIISLTDLIIQEVLATPKRCLLLCTNGTRQARTFQRHELWGLIENCLVLPNNDEQNIVHELIYKIKKNGSEDIVISYINMLSRKYKVDCWIAGCTEFHLLTSYLNNYKYQEENDKACDIIDPLVTISKNLNFFINTTKVI